MIQNQKKIQISNKVNSQIWRAQRLQMIVIIFAYRD